MSYIIDSCAWIDFFGHKKHFNTISRFLTDDLARTNQIILAELTPVAKVNKELKLISCLSGIKVVPLTINWEEIIDVQVMCLKSGMNKVGLLDIAIVQNAKQNKLGIFSTDKHIRFLSRKMGVTLLDS